MSRLKATGVEFKRVTDAAEFGRVAVLMGGHSAEREVSLMTGAAVQKALQQRGVMTESFKPAERRLTDLVAQGCDRVWIALHGHGGEDGAVQGALEWLGTPYNTGSVAPTASSYIYLDNIIACTTDGLNLQSLISLNSAEQGGTEGWFGIQSIDGVSILLDTDTNTKANAGEGYSGTGGHATTYARETIKTSMAASSSTVVSQVMDSGTLAAGNIQYQGGYDTGTGDQTGETFLDGLNGNGIGIQLIPKIILP